MASTLVVFFCFDEAGEPTATPTPSWNSKKNIDNLGDVLGSPAINPVPGVTGAYYFDAVTWAGKHIVGMIDCSTNAVPRWQPIDLDLSTDVAGLIGTSGDVLGTNTVFGFLKSIMGAGFVSGTDSLDAIQTYMATLLSRIPASVALNSDIATLLARVPAEVAQKQHLVNGTGDITPPANKGIWDFFEFLQTLHKYANNRWKVNKAAGTLTLYDDDGTTPIKVFNLKDDAGAVTGQNVYERIPQ